jgi:hypothetical protein
MVHYQVKGGVKSGLSVRAIIPLERIHELVEILGNLGSSRKKRDVRCPRKPRPKVNRAEGNVALAPQLTRTGLRYPGEGGCARLDGKVPHNSKGEESLDLLLGETLTKSLRSENIGLGNRFPISAERRPGILRNARKRFGARMSSNKIHESVLSRLLVNSAESSDHWFEVFAHFGFWFSLY